MGNALWSWKSDKDIARTPKLSTSSGVRLDVIDVSYSLTAGNIEKLLLQNVNLMLEPGDMCALMGPSGAGKRCMCTVNLIHAVSSNI